MSKQPIEEDENGIIALRKQKLQVLRDQGNAFSNDFRRSHLASELHQQYGEMSKQELADGQLETLVAGRILLKRVMGKASFLTIQDVSGRIQLYVSRNNLGEDAYEQFKSLDLGDIIGSGGVMMKTMKGELSVQAAQVRLLTKSLRPLPEKY